MGGNHEIVEKTPEKEEKEEVIINLSPKVVGAAETQETWRLRLPREGTWNPFERIRLWGGKTLIQLK